MLFITLSQRALDALCTSMPRVYVLNDATIRLQCKANGSGQFREVYDGRMGINVRSSADFNTHCGFLNFSQAQCPEIDCEEIREGVHIVLNCSVSPWVSGKSEPCRGCTFFFHKIWLVNGEMHMLEDVEDEQF